MIPVQDRFEVLSEANTTFQSLAMSKQDVYADILSYVDDILRPSRRQRTRKAEADPYLLQSREARTTPGPHVLGTVLTRGPLMDTVTITISGLTRNGRIGDDAIRVTSTVIASSLLAIAEASRSGSSRLMDSSSSEASEFLLA